MLSLLINFFYLIIITIIFGCVILIVKRRKYIEITTQLPTAYGYPFIGLACDILPFRKFLYGIAAAFHKFHCHTYCAWIGFEPYIVTIEPEIIKTVLTSEDFLNKSTTLYDSIDNVIPNGLITSRMQKWKYNRKLLNPAYANKVLLSFIPSFNKTSQQVIAQFAQFQDGKEHNVLEIIRRVIFKLAIETNMGFALDEKNMEDEKFYQYFKNIIDLAAKDAVYGTLNFRFLIRTSTYYKTLQYFRDFIRMRINAQFNLNEIQDTENNKVDGIQKNNDNYFQRALKLHATGHFKIDDIISEAHTLIAGAYDTLSTTLYSTLLMLAMHSEVQEQLYNEIITSIPNEKVEMEYDDIKNLSYLDMVLNETIRLIPAIPTIGRETIRETFIKKDLSLPAKMQIVIPIFSLHRNTTIWGQNAHCFNPDNFLAQNVEKRHPYAYIPFSRGLRNCIGWRYGTIALKIALINIIRQFKFKTNFKYENLKFIHHISIRYVHEAGIQIERRTSSK